MEGGKEFVRKKVKRGVLVKYSKIIELESFWVFVVKELLVDVAISFGVGWVVCYDNKKLGVGSCKRVRFQKPEYLDGPICYRVV